MVHQLHLIGTELAGKELVGLYQFVVVALFPHVGSSAVPVDEAHVAGCFVLGPVDVFPEGGVPQNGLDEYLVGAQGIFETFQYEGFLLEQILAEVVGDAEPLRAFLESDFVLAAEVEQLLQDEYKVVESQRSLGRRLLVKR